MKIKKVIIAVLLAGLIFTATVAQSQASAEAEDVSPEEAEVYIPEIEDIEETNDIEAAEANFHEERIEARILEVIAEETGEIEGQEVYHQSLQVKFLTGSLKGQEMNIDGMSDEAAPQQFCYHEGQKVMVYYTAIGENTRLEILEPIRRTAVYWMIAVFIILVIIILRIQGLKSLFGLVISFAVIILLIIPQILKGVSPLGITVLGVFIIFIITTPLIYGWNKKSLSALLGGFGGMLLVVLLSVVFSKMTFLTGFADEESLYLVQLGIGTIDLKGLFLAGVIIGALGVLDDVAIGQASIVKELRAANKHLGHWQVYKRAMKVGRDHLSSMVNTLVLAYAGSALSLIVLFSFKQPPFENIWFVLNNEIVVGEILRMVVGSIGILLAIPLTTLIATYIMKHKKSQNS